MKNIKGPLGKFLYGFAFLVLIPAGLWFWAKYTGQIVHLPVIESRIGGGIMIFAGGLLLLWAMVALMYYGRGLPMNGYPPSLFVTKGPYRLFRHPIYLGFGLIMIGYFVFTGSPSGFWLVSPLAILGMIALVMGYESIDLKRRFPDQPVRTILDYREGKTESPGLRVRLTSMFGVVSCFVLCNFVILKLNGDVHPLFGEPLRIIPALENPYLPFLSVIFILIIPFMVKEKISLRGWEVSGFVGLSGSCFIALLYPSIGAQYFSTAGSALFTVPVFLIFIAVKAIFWQSKRGAIIFAIVALILMLIQLANSRSAVLHLAISTLIVLLSTNYHVVWIFFKNGSENIANSWKEWVFGKVRVINHGFYVGFGAFFGILLAGSLAGKAYSLALLVSTIMITTFAALWAQIIEGSAKLKRPFGYYGGVVGILFGTLAVWAMGLNGWIVIGVGSVVMPWVQAIGRFRCLVNGCCHGRQTNNHILGIRYFHPRSRVCTISGLRGELIHPTQLYSILWLFFVGVVLLTLWNKPNVPIPLIFGLYLILTSLGRFVEEAYRGEVQTPTIKSLHLYQWTAIVVAMAGILITVIPTEPVVINPGLCWESVLGAALSGLFVFFAMGVDFPNSNVRFSRLV